MSLLCRFEESSKHAKGNSGGQGLRNQSKAMEDAVKRMKSELVGKPTNSTWSSCNLPDEPYTRRLCGVKLLF
jgi:hypothetical protein